MTKINSLPPELLSQVLGYLDTPPPSETRLHDEPHPLLLSSPEKSLKNASLVCRKWYVNALPILYRHVVWELDRWELLRVDPSQNPDKDPIDGLPLLAFLRDRELARYVDSFTMVVRDSLQGVINGGSRSVSILRTRGEEAGEDARLIPQFGSPLSTAFNQNSNWVWDMLFQLVNPLRFTILASPQVLALLLSTRIYLQDAWSFSRTTTHALSISRETKSRDDIKPAAPNPSSSESKRASEMPNELLTQLTGGVSSEVLQRRPTKLFTMRPWTHLLLNEGSSTRVYKTYEFYHRRPPSILGALLGADRKNPALVPDTLKSMAYVAVFPLSSHFHTLVDNLPCLDRLFVQIVPRDNILRDSEEMRHVQPSDLWMERNSCYSMVMREILSGELPGHDNDDDTDSDLEDNNANKSSNWHHLKEFESGDAADKEAWDMAVQFVCMSGSGWHVEREGVFVKGPPTQKPELNTTADSDEDEASSSPVNIRGNLQRLAFHGTAHLPFSPISSNMESYVLTGPVPWDIFDTGFESADVDFFGLLQDGAMGAFDDDDDDDDDHDHVGHFPITMGTIGDLAEAGHFGLWQDFEDEEGEDDEDYQDEEDEEENEEDDDIDEDDDDEDEEGDIDEDLEEEVQDILEELWAEEDEEMRQQEGEERRQEQPQPQEQRGQMDYDPFPDCYDMVIDDEDRGGNLHDAEIYYGDYAMHDTRYDPF